MRRTRFLVGRAPLSTRLVGTLMAAAIAVGYGVFTTWPARPRTWIGWVIALLWGGTIPFLVEPIWKSIERRAPADPGKRISLKRIGWALVVFPLLGCSLFALEYLQSHFLGDPLGALGKLIAPHYH